MSESSQALATVASQVDQQLAESVADAATGRVTKIRGGVVDVTFDGQIPRIQDLLYAGDLALEVAS